MNMFARFDENPAMTLEDIKETKRYGQTDGRTDNVKTVYPGGIIKHILSYHIWGLQPFWSSDLKQSIKYSIKQPSDF